MKDRFYKISFKRADLAGPALFLWNLVRILITGLWVVITDVYRQIAAFVNKVSLSVIIFSFINLLLFAAAFMPWIEYTIKLIDQETLRIGSNSKLWFLLPGFLGIFLSITDFPFRRMIYLFFLTVAALQYFAGFFYPEHIHVKFKSSSDYVFTESCYLYGPALLLSLTGVMFLNPFKNPVFHIFHLFFSRIKTEDPAPELADTNNTSESADAVSGHSDNPSKRRKLVKADHTGKTRVAIAGDSSSVNLLSDSAIRIRKRSSQTMSAVTPSGTSVSGSGENLTEKSVSSAKRRVNSLPAAKKQASKKRLQ